MHRGKLIFVLKVVLREDIGKLTIHLLSVCRWKVGTGKINNVSEEDLIQFYLGGREENTYENYKGAFNFIWKYSSEIKRSVFCWGEGEFAGLLIKITKYKKGENFLKKASAVVTLLLELAGVGSLGGSVLKLIKKAAIKKMNAYKERRTRRGANLEDIAKMIKEIYIQGRSEVSWERKRFLVLYLMLFFGIRRFGDINKLKLKDLDFKRNGEIEIWMKKTKTDTLGRGRMFSISNEVNTGITFKDILMWYLSDHDIRREDYIFFGSKNGKIEYERHVGYQEARRSLIKEQALLGLSGLTLHSARIGGATEAALAGVKRADIKEAGNWKSDAVDLYIRPKGRVSKVSRALLNGLKF